MPCSNVPVCNNSSKVSWSEGQSFCEAFIERSSNVKALDASLPEVGSATIECVNGEWKVSEGRCSCQTQDTVLSFSSNNMQVQTLLTSCGSAGNYCVQKGSATVFGIDNVPVLPLRPSKAPRCRPNLVQFSKRHPISNFSSWFVHDNILLSLDPNAEVPLFFSGLAFYDSLSRIHLYLKNEDRSRCNGTVVWCYSAHLVRDDVSLGRFFGAFGRGNSQLGKIRQILSPQLCPVAPIQRIVSLGDSIASGEGNGYGYVYNSTTQKWEGGTSNGTWEGPYSLCHQTNVAYGNVVASNYSSASFSKFACTGSTYWDGITEPRHDGAVFYAPAQFGNITTQTNMNALYDQAKPDTVLVTLGADDVGFSKVVQVCNVGFDRKRLVGDCTCQKAGNDIDQLFWTPINNGSVAENIVALANSIRVRGQALGAPVSRMVFTTYASPLTPFPVDDPCNDTFPASFTAPTCPDTWLLDQKNQMYIQYMLGTANKVILNVLSSLPGVAVADISNVYSAGHYWCSQEPWAFGLSLVGFFNHSSQAPFHPTANGHAAIASVVEGALQSFSTPCICSGTSQSCGSPGFCQSCSSNEFCVNQVCVPPCLNALSSCGLSGLCSACGLNSDSCVNNTCKCGIKAACAGDLIPGRCVNGQCENSQPILVEPLASVPTNCTLISFNASTLCATCPRALSGTSNSCLDVSSCGQNPIFNLNGNLSCSLLPAGLWQYTCEALSYANGMFCTGCDRQVNTIGSASVASFRSKPCINVSQCLFQSIDFQNNGLDLVCGPRPSSWPVGTFNQSCVNVSFLAPPQMCATCASLSGMDEISCLDASICNAGSIYNLNGQLSCIPLPGGPWNATCNATSFNDTALCAECSMVEGSQILQSCIDPTSCPPNPIFNLNGKLSCVKLPGGSWNETCKPAFIEPGTTFCADCPIDNGFLVSCRSCRFGYMNSPLGLACMPAPNTTKKGEI